MQESIPEFPLRKILQNFSLLSAAELINKGILFLATAYLARTLGPAGFGVIGFALAVITYFKMIVDFGLGVHGTREVTHHPGDGPRIVTSIVVLRLFLILIAFIAVYLFILVANRNQVEVNIILFYTLTFLPFALSIDWYFFGKEKAGWVSVSLIITQAVFAAGVFLFIQQSKDILRIPLIQTFAESLAAVLLFVAYFKSERLDFSGLRQTFVRRMISASAPIAFSNAMRTVNFTFDIVLIGFLMPPEPVGWYTASYRFVYFLVGFGVLYFKAFLAPISRTIHNSKEASHLLSHSLKASAIAVFPAAAGTTILAAPLLTFVYGGEYDAGTVPLQILIWSAVFIVLNGNFRQTLIALGDQNKLLKFTIISAASNIILNFILIPRYGLSGAAWATVISEIILLMLCVKAVISQGITILIGSSLAGPVLCTAIMSATLFFFTAPYGLAIAIFSSAVIYLVALILTRTISIYSLKGVQAE